MARAKRFVLIPAGICSNMFYQTRLNKSAKSRINKTICFNAVLKSGANSFINDTICFNAVLFIFCF